MSYLLHLRANSQHSNVFVFVQMKQITVACMAIYIFLYNATGIQFKCFLSHYAKRQVNVVPGCTSTTSPGDINLFIAVFPNDISQCFDGWCRMYAYFLQQLTTRDY